MPFHHIVQALLCFYNLRWNSKSSTDDQTAGLRGRTRPRLRVSTCLGSISTFCTLLYCLPTLSPFGLARRHDDLKNFEESLVAYLLNPRFCGAAQTDGPYFRSQRLRMGGGRAITGPLRRHCLSVQQQAIL